MLHSGVLARTQMLMEISSRYNVTVISMIKPTLYAKTYNFDCNKM